MAIITSGITTLTDLNDAIISGTQPVNPTAGTLWIDSSKSPAVLKIYKNGAWVTQDLDLNSLDPNMAESIRNVVATIGNMSNDNLLDFQERQQIKDDLTEILGKVMLDTETVLPTVSQLDTLAKGSFYSTRRNALNAGIETNNSIYVDVATQYQNLKTYLESLTPVKPWNVAVADKDKNVTVVKNTFRDKWLQYYLATEKLSLATTEKIKEAQENLDGKIDEVSLRDKTEILSGNPVFTDKSDDAVVHVGVDGLSVQNAGSGKNLFNTKAYVALEKDLFQAGTYALTADNKLVVNRTDSRGQVKSLYKYFVKLEKNTDYTFSADTIMQWRLFLFEEASEVVTGKQAIAKSTMFNSGENTLLALKVYPLSLDYPIVVGDLQLEKGSTATAYEPPAPSPDYPIAINSLDKSFDIVSSKVSGKNLYQGGQSLLRDNASNLLIKGVRSPLKKGTYIFSVKEAKMISKWRMYFALFKNGQVVKEISAVATHLTSNNARWNNASIYQNITVGVYLSSADTDALVYEITLNDDYEVVWGFANTGGDSNEQSEMLYPQIELGTIQTPYESPVRTDNTHKTNILLSEPLRSVGDVKDRLFLDTDDLWKVERNVGERIFTGTESAGWVYETSSKGYYTAISDKHPRDGSKNDIFFSTHFNYSSNTVIPLGSTRVGGNTNVIFNWDDGASGVAGFKNWLVAQKTAGNPVTIQYKLATPKTETLSAEQQTKLNNIQSFKGSNYVYTVANVEPNLNARFKSNMWYRMNVLGEKQVSGNRNWVTNGNLAYPLEKSLWSSYYKGTVREVVDISTEAPPFKNALHIKQTTNGVAGIIDAVIWEGAEANVLSGQNISMATWIKYQNISNESLVMQVQVTGKTSSGLFSYDYPKVFSHTGTDLTWKRQTGTVKISLPDGAVEITRVAFRLGLAGTGTGEFWATGIQLETGNTLGDWSINPNDTEEELNKTEARFILTEKEVGLSVKKNELINGVLVNGDGVKIDGRNVDINGLVTFGSFDTTTKNAIDAKSTKAEAQGYATNAQNASKSYTDTEAGKIKTTVTAVSDIANSLKNFTDTAFSDGIIQRAEAQAISEHLNTLKKENDDLGNQYNVVYANANLTGTPKTNLASAKTAYNTAYTNLVTSINTAISGDKTTPAQKTDVDTKYTAYSTALKLLTQRLTESQTAVSEKIANDLAVAKANLAEVNAKAHADGKVTAEETRAIADAEAKLALAKNHAETKVAEVKAITDTKANQVEAMGGIGKIFKNPISKSYTNGNNTGYLVITTPITSSYMTRISITGYNYVSDTSNIDLDISFYAYIGGAFLNHSYTNKGNFPIDSVTIGRNVNGQAVIVIGKVNSVWLYPNIQVTEAMIGFQNPPDSYKTGWSIDFATSIADLTNTYAVVGTDYKTALATAQTDATNAKTSAGTANQLLADLSNDNILTPVEKKSIKKEWDIIVGEKAKIDVEATEFGIVTEKATYNTQYSTLNTYVTPLLANLNANSNIVATTFRTNFKNYYDARQDLLNAITSKAKTLADSATELANNASILAGTKSKTFTTTPTTPYVSGDVWKNGTAVYISTANRTSGTYVLADWVLVGDVTSANTANDVSNVGGVASGTVRDRATNGNTAYASTSLWKSTNLTTINGGQITTDTITSGAIKSDVALINKLFVSDANINALTGKSAFINSIKAVDISADRVNGGTLSGITITSPFDYVYEGTTRNKGTMTLAGGTLSTNGLFTGGFGTTYLKLNADGLYGDNLKSDGSIRSLFKINGDGVTVVKENSTAYYRQDGVHFESGGNAYIKYSSPNARIEIASYNGVGLGVNSAGVYQNRITMGGGTEGLDPFVDIWSYLTMRDTLNMSGQEIKNATSITGVQNILFQDTSNRIVQGSDNILNIMSPAQISMGYTNGTTTSNSLVISNAGTTFQKQVQFNGNPINGANNINNAQNILFNGSSNRIVQGNDGFFNILAPIQLNLGWTDGSTTFNTMVITKNQIVARRVLNMDGNSITNQSDRRLKKNITLASEDSLDAIVRWSFVNYEWINPEKKQGIHLGLISQDTPELSVYDAESDIYNIDSSKQTMINSHAIQQMYKKFTSEIKELKDRINEMERKI